MPQPIVPTPGIRPAQFVKRMKMKIVAKNQKVFFTSSWPMMLSRKLCRLSTSHSQKFCAPSGTSLIFAVAYCAKKMMPSATIQVTIMELVTANGPNFAGSEAVAGWPPMP